MHGLDKEGKRKAIICAEVRQSSTNDRDISGKCVAFSDTGLSVEHMSPAKPSTMNMKKNNSRKVKYNYHIFKLSFSECVNSFVF